VITHMRSSAISRDRRHATNRPDPLSRAAEPTELFHFSEKCLGGEARRGAPEDELPPECRPDASVIDCRFHTLAGPLMR